MSIQKSKKCDYDSFIFALGIPNVGKKTAKDLSKSFPTLEKLIDATEDELAKIKDIGEIVAKSIKGYFSDNTKLSVVQKLLDLGVEITYKQKASQGIFTGQTFVLTGTLQNYTRSKASEIIESLGGQTSSSVSKNTTYLLAGEDAGSKLQKAQNLGIKIINEQEFEQLIKK